MRLLVWFLVWGLAAAPTLAEQGVSVDATGFVAFSRIDSDHNGYVSRVEARSVGAVEAAFDQADSNRDGLLSQGEYARVRPSQATNPS